MEALSGAALRRLGSPCVGRGSVIGERALQIAQTSGNVLAFIELLLSLRSFQHQLTSPRNLLSTIGNSQISRGTPYCLEKAWRNFYAAPLTAANSNATGNSKGRSCRKPAIAHADPKPRMRFEHRGERER